MHEEDEVLYIDKVESRYPVRMYSRIGKPVAITVAAVAKLLLADLPEPERRAARREARLPLYTARSTPNAAAFLKELAKVREQGWATDLGGHEESINCVARPHPRRRRPGRRRHVGLRAERRRHRRRTPHPAPAGAPHRRGHQPRVLRQDRPSSPRPRAPSRHTADPSTRNHSHDREAPDALTPATHTTPPAKFSHGVRKGNILQVAGQVGFLPAVDGQAPDARRSRPCASRPSRPSPTSSPSCEEGGASWDDVMMIRVYLTDTDALRRDERRSTTSTSRTSPRPRAARTTVYVGLPAGLLVEIDALAVLG